MRLTNKTDYKDWPARRNLATALSRMVCTNIHFTPYNPQPEDNYFYTLDSGNNWKLKFFEDKPFVFEITFRYNCKDQDYETGLFHWLEIAIGASKSNT